MAKKRVNPLKGLTIKDLLDIDPDTLQHMNRSEMRQVVQRLSDAANKRLRRIEDAGFRRGHYIGEDSIAGTKKFSTRGKNVGQLHAEYKRLREFLESPTSTLRGKRKQVEKVRKAFNEFRNEINATLDDNEYVYEDPFSDDNDVPIPDDYDYISRDSTQIESDMYRIWEDLYSHGEFKHTGIDDSNVQQAYVKVMVEKYSTWNNEDIKEEILEDLKRRYESRQQSSFHGRVSI